MALRDVALVLLDVQMPRMDGFEVARRIRSDSHARLIPIIFIFGMTQTDEILNQGYGAGAMDFIAKPVKPATLLHKVRVLLEHDRHRRQLLLMTQQLEHERAFNASILDNTAEGILVVGDEGHIRFVTQRSFACLAATPAS